MRWGYLLTAAVASVGVFSAGAIAQEAKPATAEQKSLTLELNSVSSQANNSCRMTFVAHNGIEADLESAGFEVVLFDKKGLVNRMTVFDFGALPNGKTLVKRFDLPETDCADLSRVLVNGVARCEGAGIDSKNCANAIATRNKTDLTFGS
ncbi:hypothetical protein [Notoacmeibacter ruber]|uniref:Tat pathway signal sequence domain protein n=1 Tax=Notoacmeibacter ruber TaxID=2670375 RepID=A0A3L7JF92_9HYPH|nr:hypothetical protein [Notoacmeibacter ruber]RLQ88251.1 hypothetical protein D8780_08575 [Notoacmeibacter ruber]